MEVDTLSAAPESERYIIGAMVAYPDAADEACKLLRGADFNDRCLGIIFDRMAQYHAAGGINPPVIGRDLRDHKEFFGTSAAAVMYELAQPENAPTPIHVAGECAKIVNAREKRQLFEIADNARSASLNGQSAADVLGMLRGDLWEFERAAASKGKPAFPITTAAELSVANYPIVYIVERLLVESQFCILGGPKKALKTTLAIVLAICIALGIPFLGQFGITRRRSVLVCSCESGMATIKDIALRVCESLGVKLAEIDNLAFSPNVPKPHDAKSWGEFCRMLEDHRPDVLFLDALYRMLTGDGAESLFKMAVPLGEIDAVCQSLGITPIVCHHLKTGRINQFAPADMDDLAYAGVAEFMRQGIMLTRREPYEPGTGVHRLWLNIGGSAGHNSLWALDANEGTVDDSGGRHWATALTRADDARDAAQQRKSEAKATEATKLLDEERTKVCRLMAKHPGGKSKTFIRDHCGVSSRRFPAVFAAMFEAGELVECEIMVSNKKTPQAGYSLETSEVS